MSSDFLCYRADDQWFDSLWPATVWIIDFGSAFHFGKIRSCYWDLFFLNFVGSKVSWDFHVAQKWKSYSYLARLLFPLANRPVWYCVCFGPYWLQDSLCFLHEICFQRGVVQKHHCLFWSRSRFHSILCFVSVYRSSLAHLCWWLCLKFLTLLLNLSLITQFIFSLALLNLVYSRCTKFLWSQDFSISDQWTTLSYVLVESSSNLSPKLRSPVKVFLFEWHSSLQDHNENLTFLELFGSPQGCSTCFGYYINVAFLLFIHFA